MRERTVDVAVRCKPLALSAGLCTADSVGMRLTVCLVVLTEQRQSGTRVTEFAVTLRGTFLSEYTDAFHAPTLRRDIHTLFAANHRPTAGPVLPVLLTSSGDIQSTSARLQRSLTGFSSRIGLANPRNGRDAHPGT